MNAINAMNNFLPHVSGPLWWQRAITKHLSKAVSFLLFMFSHRKPIVQKQENPLNLSQAMKQLCYSVHVRHLHLQWSPETGK